MKFKFLAWFLMLAPATPVFSDEISLDALNKAFAEFLETETCEQVIARMRLGKLDQTPVEDQLKSFAMYTFMSGYARGKNLPMKEAGLLTMEKCRNNPQAVFVEVAN